MSPLLRRGDTKIIIKDLVQNYHSLSLSIKPAINIPFCIYMYIRFCHCLFFTLHIFTQTVLKLLSLHVTYCCFFCLLSLHVVDYLFINEYILIHDVYDVTHYQSSAFLIGSNVTSTNHEMLSVYIG
jgi:hypothetical protein